MLLSPSTARRSAFVVIALVAAAALSQETPRIGVAPTTVAVGGTVTLEARGLPSGAEHSITVSAPSGAQFLTVRAADGGGALSVELTLDEPGAHRVHLVGERIEALFVVTAVAERDDPPAPPAAPQPPPSADEPEPGAPAEEPPVADDREPDAAAPAPETPTDTAPPEPREVPTDDLELVVEDGGATLRGDDGEVVWRFERPEASGDTRAALLHLGRAWVAHGHTLFEIDVERGQVLRRTPLSGPITTLAPAGTAVRARVAVGVAGGTIEYDHRVEEGRAQPPATFDPYSPLFGWWIREADVADPAAMIGSDATNPHLHLRVAAGAATAGERDEHVEAALRTATTFYDLAHAARTLVGMGEWEAAEEAMSRALDDFEARGYDTELLTDPGVHERYGFPLRPLRLALERGDLETARFWAPWLLATAAVELPSAGGALRAYADALQAADERDESAAFREHAGRFGSVTTRTVLGETALGLGRGGWYASVALLVATALLHLTLLAKYWRPQSLMLRQARESGQRIGPFARWRVMRYYGLTEKAALLLLLAATYAVAALAVWAARGDVAVRAVSAGHLEAPFVAPVIALAEGDRSRVDGIEGYLAARRGDEAAARRAFERALAAGDPDAGRSLDALAAGERVPAPSRFALRDAVSGSWTTAIGRAFANPFAALDDGIAAPRVPSWAWPAIVTLFVIVVLLHVFILFVPRPRVARNAPRTPAYHALSLLVPGSGAADELYGVLLLVPTAVFGLDALLQLVGTGSPLGIPLRTSAWILVALYLVNAVAVAIEFTSYRRRMQDLRREQPDLARAYGLRELPEG